MNAVPGKYFILRGQFGFELYVNLLAARVIFHVNSKTIQNGIRRNRIGKSVHWSHLEFSDGIYLSYEMIPATTKYRCSLPMSSEAACEMLKIDARASEEMYRNYQVKIGFENLKKFYFDRWPCYVKYYKEKFPDRSEVKRYAQTHALISHIISENERGETLKTLFEYYKRIVFEELTSGHRLVFSTQNLNSFLRKIREARCSISGSLLHNSLGRKRHDLAVLDEDDKNFIMDLKSNANGHTFRTIQGKLLKERGVHASISTLKRLYYSDDISRNVAGDFSKGNPYKRKNLRPTLQRIFQYPGDQYQADGSKLQFLCIDHIGRIVTLTYYAVIDAYSRKVVGVSADLSENSEMIISAFKMAFISEGYLPKEITYDNAPSYSAKAFKKFRSDLEHLGVICRPCHKDYPLEKAEVESFFSTFQKVICSKYPYYLGEGVKSRNKYGNPSVDINKKYWQAKRSLLSVNDLKLQLFKMIKEYNYEYFKETIESSYEVSGEAQTQRNQARTIYEGEVILA